MPRVLAAVVAAARPRARRGARRDGHPAPARAPRRPEPDDLRQAPRPVHDRLLRDAAEGGRRPSRRRCPGAIVAMDARLVDKAGNVIPQQVTMLHHLVFTNGGPDDQRGDPVCPRKTTRERFWGTSEELRAADAPARLRLPDRTRPTSGARSLMVMHHRAGEREFYVEYRVTVDPRPVIPVKPYWLSIVPCSPDPQWTVPGGGTKTHTPRAHFTMPDGGPDRRRRRPPARRRAGRSSSASRAARTARSSATGPPTRPPATRSTRSARSCTSPTRRTSAGGSRRPAGRSRRASGSRSPRPTTTRARTRA